MADSIVQSFSSDSSNNNVQNSGSGSGVLEPNRNWRDVFWLLVFVVHWISSVPGLFFLGLNRFMKTDWFNLHQYGFLQNKKDLTEYYWLFYAVAGSVGAAIGWSSLIFLGCSVNQKMMVSVHILTTYFAVISVLCFCSRQLFWCGVVFAIWAGLQFLYVISVIDRLPYTMAVLQKAVKMVCNLPEVMRLSYAFIVFMLLWMGIWSLGVAGAVASSMGNGLKWFSVLGLSVSLLWTGAVLCNMVHVVVSRIVFLVLFHGSRDAEAMPPKLLLRSLGYACTTSFGSICYGSLFTAPFRTLRWEIRGIRSRVGNNECLLCCVDFLFNLVEIMVRFFNKYAYVHIAVMGKSFNNSARDAWEQFQLTGVEALVSYDCSGAVLLMCTILGGLVTGTCAAAWAWVKTSDEVLMVGSTAMLMGILLVGLAMVVVESAVTAFYTCYADDPLLIQRWDADLFNQVSQTLHMRLQHRSSQASQVSTHNQLHINMQL